MPPRLYLGIAGHPPDIDYTPSTLTSNVWRPSTIARDFAFDHASKPINNLDTITSWSRNVDPAGANRSVRSLAPSVASHVNDTSVRDANQGQLDFRPATIEQSYLSREWPDLPYSIPILPIPSPSNPFNQPALRDGLGASFNHSPLESATTLAIASSLTPRTLSTPKEKAVTVSKANSIKKTKATAPSRGLNEKPSPSPKEGSDVRKKQKKAVGVRAMTPSGSSERGDNGRKATPLTHKHDGSLSSTQSNQSHISYDFSKVDRSGESIVPPGILRLGQRSSSLHSQRSLPDEKGFSIQIGSELFKLSGASIMSDAPSYFSAFFIDQLEQNDARTGGVRTLFIDRDPETFREIARHLQGYLISPVDGSHFVKLFADAQFYRLPRLQSQLFESEIFVEVGNEHFRIPRDIFSSPGDTPNYFTLGFTLFFTSPGDVFPGLNPRGLLRPPAIHPPRIPNRSPQIFADLLHMLRGYNLTIRNSDHRQQLLKDARYYNLRGLEQRLIPHAISHNLSRQVSEIVIRLQDIRPSQIAPEHQNKNSNNNDTPSPFSPRYITYARPYIDEIPYHLILETSSLSLSSTESNDPISLNIKTMRATFFGTTKSRITSLFQTVANKLNLPTTIPLGLRMMEKENGGAAKGMTSPGSTPLSENAVKVVVDETTHVLLDGREWDWDAGVINSAVGDANVEREVVPQPEAEIEAEEEAGVEDLVQSPSLDLWQNDYFPTQQSTTSMHTNTKRPPSPSSAALNPPITKRAKHDHVHDHATSTESGNI